MAGVAAIHHPLGDVDPGAGDVRLLVQIGNGVDWTAVNAHSDTKGRMVSQSFADLHSAENRRFDTIPKHKRASVTRGQTQELAFGFGESELFSAADDLF